jgi:hypothetical protein
MHPSGGFHVYALFLKLLEVKMTVIYKFPVHAQSLCLVCMPGKYPGSNQAISVAPGLYSSGACWRP